jgi:hypothetical protein
METDDIDYQRVYEVLRNENEALRINIVGLRENGYTLKEKVNDWFDALWNNPRTVLYIMMFISISAFLWPIVCAVYRWIVAERKSL